MKKNIGILRVNAQQAKLRLEGGFWMEEQSRRSKLGDSLEKYVQHVKRQVCESDTREEQFYEKIRKILCANSGTSPLAQVLDREHMQTIGSAERERYVFLMSAKVQKCIERFRQECELGLVHNA